ncbi:hypothetical protein [Lacticaseibacillus hulanensis]|uniref:hypothetical protein n=1 Tax=Lacticaseibacillus hulanensis TaxID=2493111 RepID=UPI0013E34F8D|nr:hypothetical protein [Lacticaseibacillus hulanensis]
MRLIGAEAGYIIGTLNWNLMLNEPVHLPWFFVCGQPKIKLNQPAQTLGAPPLIAIFAFDG